MYSQIGQTIDLLANLLILNAISFIKIPFLLILLRSCVLELSIELLLHLRERRCQGSSLSSGEWGP